MKIDKNKKQKNLERVFVAPNFRPFLCLTIKEDTDVEDEFEIADEEGNVRKIQQTIHGQVFTTEIVHEQDIKSMNSSMREESKITYVLPIGTRLVWEEGQGYMATTNQFQTLEEIEDVMKLLK